MMIYTELPKYMPAVCNEDTYAKFHNKMRGDKSRNR